VPSWRAGVVAQRGPAERVTNPRRSPSGTAPGRSGLAEQCGEDSCWLVGSPDSAGRVAAALPRGAPAGVARDESTAWAPASTVGPPRWPRPRPKAAGPLPAGPFPPRQFQLRRLRPGELRSAWFPPDPARQTGTRARRPPCRLARSRPSCSGHRQAGQLLDGLGQAARARARRWRWREPPTGRAGATGIARANRVPPVALGRSTARLVGNEVSTARSPLAGTWHQHDRVQAGPGAAPGPGPP